MIGRKPGESVQIGEILVKVHAVNGRQVTLAITAPKEMEITRPDYDKDESEQWQIRRSSAFD